MLRLLVLLSACLFLVMLIGGRDYGQMRPGLAAAYVKASEPVIVMAQPAPEPAAPPVVQVAYAAEPEMPLVLPLVKPDQSVATDAVQAIAEPAEPAGEIRYISAGSVNVREGPSTEYPVVGRLTRGEAALVIWTEDNGWARISIEGDGLTGYVAGQFLSPAP